MALLNEANDLLKMELVMQQGGGVIVGEGTEGESEEIRFRAGAGVIGDFRGGFLSSNGGRTCGVLCKCELVFLMLPKVGLPYETG